MNDWTMRRLGWGLTTLFALFMLGASIAPRLLGAEISRSTMAELG